MSMAKKSKETMINATEEFPGEGNFQRRPGQGGQLFFTYRVVFFTGELKAEVFPGRSLNSLVLPSLVLASPRGLQFPLPVTQPPDSMP